VDEDTEIDEDDEVSVIHHHHYLFLFTSALTSILVLEIFLCMRFVCSVHMMSIFTCDCAVLREPIYLSHLCDYKGS